MASKTQICNLSLSHLNIGRQIADVDTEQSEEAAACRAFYDIVLEAVLRDYDWPHARRFQALALVEEEPNDEWGFSYRFPVGCTAIRKIYSGVRTDTRQSRVEYEIGNDSAGKLVYTDQDDAQIRFTYLETDPQKYPADFTLALSYRLATYIAPRLTKGDPFKLGDKAMQMYRLEVGAAVKNAFNEEQPAVPVEAETIRLRE